MAKNTRPVVRISAEERQKQYLAEAQKKKLDKQKDDPNTMKDAGALAGYSIGAAGVANLAAKEWGNHPGSEIVHWAQYAGIACVIILAAIFMVFNFVAAWRLVKAYRDGSQNKKFGIATIILILFVVVLVWLELRAILLIIPLP